MFFARDLWGVWGFLFETCIGFLLFSPTKVFVLTWLGKKSLLLSGLPGKFRQFRERKRCSGAFTKNTQQAKTVGKCVQLYWASCGRPKCRHDVELLFVFRVLLCSWSWSVFRVQGLWFCFRAGSYCTPTHSILQGFRRSFALLSLPYP